MENLLIIGIDTTIGANLGATLSETYNVTGIAAHRAFSMEDLNIAKLRTHDFDSVFNVLEQIRPDWIIDCGLAPLAVWNRPESGGPSNEIRQSSRQWAHVAAKAGARLTLISSDAVFTGPWIFHNESCDCQCPSSPAELIRDVERQTLELCPQAFIARTNAFGWSPAAIGPGWIEQSLSQLKLHGLQPFDHIHHTTPILATTLAEILALAEEKKLSGTYHISGAERINQTRFAEQLAGRFHLPALRMSTGVSLSQRPRGFGRGESSLNTTAIRNALGISLPIIADEIDRLLLQLEDGYCERLQASELPVSELVA